MHLQILALAESGQDVDERVREIARIAKSVTDLAVRQGY
jgi:hypothetical protein